MAINENKKIGIIAIIIGGGMLYWADELSKYDVNNDLYHLVSYFIGIPGFCILAYGVYEFFKKSN